ncbi:LPO_1073/Vpar_1526 family protein [Pedobacter agri]|uniref:LPO_1073/Vpar_1526 family protein n=1 Tax=Pedobacter agri TaxID=454586 RepID=UPI00293154EC|nr:LPO_1073/Vpar_1526 family protein [Pedobacter agri]
MALKSETNLNAGDQSTNNQAQTINNHYTGITYTDAKAIATDVFKDNFIKLRDEAAEIATQRALEFSEKLLTKIEAQSPEALNEFASPGMQDSLFTAQKEYAINGDDEMADMLVEILIERAQNTQKNRLRIVLDESLKIAPKLTVHQMDLLTVTHIIRRTYFQNLGTFDDMIKRMNHYYNVMDFIDQSQVDQDLGLLEYMRLGKIHITEYPSPMSSWITNYPEYLNYGFKSDQCPIPEINSSQLFIPNFHKSENIQFRFPKLKYLTETLKSYHLTDERINHIQTFYNSNLLSQDQVTDAMRGKLINLEKIIEMHNQTQWSSFELSPVGHAIAISNFHRRTKEKLDMGIWIK